MAGLLDSSPGVGRGAPLDAAASWELFGDAPAAARVQAAGLSARALRRPVPVATTGALMPGSDDGQAGDGELSPSFDASFTSTLCGDPDAKAADLARSISPGVRSDAMDISPDPRSRTAPSARAEPAPPFTSSFFTNLRQHKPPSLKSRSGSATSLDDVRAFGAAVPNGAAAEVSASRPPSRPPSRVERRTSKPRCPIPPVWQTAKPNIQIDDASAPRNTDPGRASAALALDGMLRCNSAPTAPDPAKLLTSSPNAMDVDGRSPTPSVPGAHQAGAFDALAEAFHDNLSPAPVISRKRSFTPAHEDPTPSTDPDHSGDEGDVGASPLAGHSRRIQSGALTFQPLGVARAFEKAHSTTSGLGVSLNARRRQTHARRPSLQAAFSASSIHDVAPPPSKRARDLDGSKLVRPQLIPTRRTQSVCVIPPVVPSTSDSASLGLGRPSSSAVPGRLARPSLADTRRVMSMGRAPDMQIDDAEDAPSEPTLPAHASEEADGKALPCHKVSADGLMRIKPAVLSDLLDGKYDALIDSYIICDARFAYEHEGGHVRGAINLQNEAQVERHFLHLEPSVLPRPARSGEDHGRKVVLIFHCEFSAKRAPTLAKHLRSRDRALNASHYPRVHYPELYILEGGYADFFAKFPRHCDPQCYVPMDDPQHVGSRHLELNSFRRRQTFARARSDSALGTMQSKGAPAPFLASMAVQSTRAIAEEDHEPHAAVTSSPSGSDVGDSPCPANARRSMTVPMGRRPLERTASLWQ